MLRQLLLLSFCLTITMVTISAQTYDVRDFGAIGDGNTLDTKSLQAAIDKAARDGGGTVLLPAGRFKSGTLHLRSNIELHLTPGATLLGSDHIADYDTAHKHLLYAYNVTNVALTGMGKLDGQGFAYYDTTQAYWTAKDRPEPWLLLEGCERVRIRDVGMYDAPSHVLVFKKCNDVVADGLTVRCDYRSPNTDGIDITDSKQVRISNCDLQAGDDLICLKSHDNWVEQVTVTNCVLSSDDSAIKFGTGSKVGVRNSTFSNITIHKSRYGIALFMIDGGTHEHCVFDNITIRTDSRWDNEYPIFIDIHKRTPDKKLGRIKDMQFRNISIQSSGNILIAGQPGQPLEDLVFDGVNFTVTGCNDLEKYAQKPRGSKTLKPIPELVDYCKQPAHWTLAHIDGLKMNNIVLRKGRKLAACDRDPLWMKDVSHESIGTPDIGSGLKTEIIYTK